MWHKVNERIAPRRPSIRAVDLDGNQRLGLLGPARPRERCLAGSSTPPCLEKATRFRKGDKRDTRVSLRVTGRRANDTFPTGAPRRLARTAGRRGATQTNGASLWIADRNRSAARLLSDAPERLAPGLATAPTHLIHQGPDEREAWATLSAVVAVFACPAANEFYLSARERAF